jgi:hypothetical protein
MAAKSDFLKQANVQMIWEIIAEHPAIKGQPPKVSSEVYNVMIQNIQGFYERETTRMSSLVELNKKFISILIQYISEHYAQKSHSNVKIEDIQYERQSKFEQELKQKQSDFSNAMSLPTPPTPRFKDETLELPMTEMAAALKKATEQRNYDMDVINKTRGAVPTIKINENVDRKVPTQDIIDLSSPSKHITWAPDENIVMLIDEPDDDSIDIGGLFKKLKRVDPPVTTTNDRIQSLETKVDLIIKMLGDLAKR